MSHVYATSMRALSPGHGALVVERQGDRSHLACIESRAPLKLLAPKNHGHARWVYVGTFGGGLVDGDEVHLEVEVGASAGLFLGTQASTKVYRGTSRVTTDARVGEGGLLVSVPDPVVCFAGASFTQRTRVELAQTGSVFVVDTLHGGRIAHGERWEFAAYETRTEVFRDRRPVLLDAIALRDDEGSIGRRMRRFEAMASLYFVGPAVREAGQSALARVRAEVGDATEPAAPSPAVVASASTFDDGASVLVRLLGETPHALAAAIRPYFDFLPELLGDSPLARRP